MVAYYNEIDPQAAAWLRELIKRGLIAPGEVDERSIEDVRPDDLRGFIQCHFFAGIGVWSYALRLVGWPDDRPIWTGSCPCQPFSAAGKSTGFDDERHLWPAFHHLIRERRPAIVAGEQVASKDGLGWLDLVYVDMEAEGYALGPLDTCSAGSGAPHIRQRLRFAGVRVAESAGSGHEGRQSAGSTEGYQSRRAGADGGLAYAFGSGLEGHGGHVDDGRQSGRLGTVAPRPTTPAGLARGLADADGRHTSPEWQQRGGEQRLVALDGLAGGLALTDEIERGRWADAPGGLVSDGAPAERDEGDGGAAGICDGGALGVADADSGARGQGCEIDGWGDQGSHAIERGRLSRHGRTLRPGSTNGFWGHADWLRCRDDKWRPVRPGSFPLAHGAPARVVRLRGYGNAVDAYATADFLEALQDTLYPPLDASPSPDAVDHRAMIEGL